MISNKKIILVGVHGRPSIKSMYAQMEDKSVELHVRRRNPKTKKEYFRVYKNGDAVNHTIVPLNEISYENCTIVRWGNCVQVPLNNCIVYNKSEAIALASNKGHTRQVLSDKGVAVPVIVKPVNAGNVKYPIIARPQAHAKGKNVVILKTQNDYNNHRNNNNNWYYAEFFPKDREIRVHVAFGKVVAVMEKPAPKDKSTVAWNRAVVHEEWNAVKWSDYPFEACKQALLSVKALGLDTGGVDVMIKGKEAKVLEINTAPTLISSPYVTKRYAMLMDWLFRNNKRRKHWDFETFKKADSFAWKNNQLLDKKQTEDD